MIRLTLAISLSLFSGAAVASNEDALIQACVEEHRDLGKCRCAHAEMKKGLSAKDYETFMLMSLKANELKDNPNAMAQFMMSGVIDMADMGRLAQVMSEVGMKAARTCNMEVVMPDSPFGG
ncbi:hypothetical protein [Pseudokordiimonas caeni]|uniref:hypothetical protein n=1 Tax=Pseudokordiimonas caeni TaxID=2997908 RepID=UPI0028128630|nr:hypothetical protein [Pseudokordiimonas caeni]